MASISVILPARNESLLLNTACQCLEAAKDPENLTLFVIMDGWEKNKLYEETLKELKKLPINIIIHEECKGLRYSTNIAALESTDDYMIKMDAHSEIGNNWDYDFQKCYEDQGPEALMLPCMRGFSPEMKWGPTAYIHNFITPEIDKVVAWGSYDDGGLEVCETMAFTGGCWFTSLPYWFSLGGHDESLGIFGGIGIELSLKAWLSGGRLVVNKRIQWAHRFRKNFPYSLSDAGWVDNVEIIRNYWDGTKFHGQKHPISWLVGKFWPVPRWTSSLSCS